MCEGSTRIEVDSVPGEAGLQPFEYRVHPGRRRQTTVVLLPGGPGGTAMGFDRRSLFFGPDVPVLTYDTRGFGCNAHPDVDWDRADAFTTEAVVADLAAVLAAERLDDYVLYGVSYGTQVATVLASEVESYGLAPPRAVVLEGTLGPATARNDVGFTAAWAAFLPTLSEEHQALLTEEEPLGFAGFAWGSAIADRMFLGQTSAGEPLRELLESLGTGTPEEDELLRELADRELAGVQPWEPQKRRIRDGILCQEMSEVAVEVLSLEAGTLVGVGDECEDIGLVRPYQPVSLGVPVVYVQGSADPITPADGARIHHDLQPADLRVWVGVDGAGHNPLWDNLDDCNASILANAADPVAVRRAAERCGWSVSRD